MRVHLVGIGGAAMSALANVYLDRGAQVTGSDLRRSEVTDALIAAGARIRIGHSADTLGRVDLMVTSTAVAEDNVEVAAARRRGIRVIHRSQAVAELISGRRQIAIAGTHGKTTITTFCAAALASVDPLVLSGGRLPGSAFNSRPGHGRLAIVEADESDLSFLRLSPEIAVISNVEADHLDRFAGLEEITGAFIQFAVRSGGTVIACADDAGAATVLAAAPGETLSYGFGAAEVRGFDYRAEAGGSSFGVETPWGGGLVALRVPGRHNALNALAAVAVSALLGLDVDGVADRLGVTELPGRRMELVGEVGGARVYDDYGHHPTEVRATLAAARELCQGRLVCAFQPHRYSRLRALLDEFARAFGGADELLLVPVYPAGEEPPADGGADSAALATAVVLADPALQVTLLESLEELPEALRARLREGDVCVCMGAGDIYHASRELVRDGAAAEAER
jgi:UDP-N-acetylmuramate--alanine ligase